MSEEKIVAEQQHGRFLYNKLKIDFQDDLYQGRVVGLDHMPESAFRNAKAGIAFEAFEQKDYRTAEAFFAQLGKGYEDWKDQAASLWMEEYSKSEEKPKTLLEKIDGIDIPRVKFEYAQEKILEIASRHDITKAAVKGEIDLVKMAEGLEKELEEIYEIRNKGQLRKKILDYQPRLESLEGALKEFLSLDLGINQDLENYKQNKLKKTAGNALGLCGIMGTLFLGAGIIGAGIASGTLPLLCAGIGGLSGSMASAIKGIQLEMKEDEKERIINELFGNLKISSAKVGSAIHQAFITDFYSIDPGIFKARFEKMGEGEQRYVINQLLKKKEKNEKIDAWLIENYAQLIEEEGITSLCEQ